MMDWIGVGYVFCVVWCLVWCWEWWGCRFVCFLMLVFEDLGWFWCVNCLVGWFWVVRFVYGLVWFWFVGVLVWVWCGWSWGGLFSGIDCRDWWWWWIVRCWWVVGLLLCFIIVGSDVYWGCYLCWLWLLELEI